MGIAGCAPGMAVVNGKADPGRYSPPEKSSGHWDKLRSLLFYMRGIGNFSITLGSHSRLRAFLANNRLPVFGIRNPSSALQVADYNVADYSFVTAQ
jgi:hypothetical protein